MFLVVVLLANMISATNPAEESLFVIVAKAAHGADNKRRGGGMFGLGRWLRLRDGHRRDDAVKQDEARVTGAAEAGTLFRGEAEAGGDLAHPLAKAQTKGIGKVDAGMRPLRLLQQIQHRHREETVPPLGKLRRRLPRVAARHDGEGTATRATYRRLMDQRKVTLGDSLAAACGEDVRLAGVKKKRTVERTGKTALELTERKTVILVLHIVVEVVRTDQDMVLPDAEAVSREEEQEEVAGAESGRQVPHLAEDLLLARRVREKLHLVVARAVLEEAVQVRRVAHGAGEVRDVAVGVLVNPDKQCVAFHGWFPFGSSSKIIMYEN